jgi:sortase A
LLLIGVGALGYSGYVYFESYLYQKYQDWAFNREVKERAEVEGDVRPQQRAPRHGPDSDAGPPQPAPRPKPVRPLVGRIEVPRLNLSAIIKEGVDSKTLRRAVGHVPETVRPGVPGNVGLAGHRDTFFRPLQRIRKHDRIVVETLDGRFEYVVQSLEIVQPTDVHVLSPTKESVLTLVTCYPFQYVGNAPKRFIVRARQTEAVLADSAAPDGSGIRQNAGS